MSIFNIFKKNPPAAKARPKPMTQRNNGEILKLNRALERAIKNHGENQVIKSINSLFQGQGNPNNMLKVNSVEEIKTVINSLGNRINNVSDGENAFSMFIKHIKSLGYQEKGDTSYCA